MKVEVGDVVGDFKMISNSIQYNNIKWLDRLTSCIVSYWDCPDMPAIHVLYDYDFNLSTISHSNYSREISCGDKHHIHYVGNSGMSLVMEGICLEFKNTTMDNILLDNGYVLDRFRKQVLDIVKS